MMMMSMIMLMMIMMLLTIDVDDDGGHGGHCDERSLHTMVQCHGDAHLQRGAGIVSQRASASCGSISLLLCAGAGKPGAPTGSPLGHCRGNALRPVAVAFHNLFVCVGGRGVRSQVFLLAACPPGAGKPRTLTGHPLGHFRGTLAEPNTGLQKHTDHE